MKINRFAYILFVVVLCIACKNEKKIEHAEVKDSSKQVDKGGFPKETPLSELKSTEFALTLENELSDSKNSIYAPAFLFAWQEIKDFYKSPINISPSNSLDFRLINTSETFQGTLSQDEYETHIDASDDAVSAEAYFKKSLPFAMKFHTQDETLVFKGDTVKTFGINFIDDLLLEYFEVLYYLDDDHFVVKLIPADTDSEIILAKGVALSGSFSDLYQNTNVYIQKGATDKQTKGKEWRYTFEKDDYLSIPVIGFNIGTHYSTLEDQSFSVGPKPHMILKAYQRTAFVLNESGAEIESYGHAVTDSIGAEPIEKPTPKNMVFDKPFVIFIKKKNSINPYFAMRVMNTELMEKK